VTRSKNGNVLLLSIDALRADCVGLNPDKRRLARFELEKQAETPLLDAFFQHGVFFPNGYTTAPYTTAAHASMLTGCWTTTHNVREYFRTPISLDVPTLFSLYKAKGYVTILATDYPAILGPLLGFTKDVDIYIAEDDDEVLEQLKAHANEPIFCFWHVATVHSPFGLTSLDLDGRYFEQAVGRVAELADIGPSSTPVWQWDLEAPRSRQERELREFYYQSIDALYTSQRYSEIVDLYIEGLEYFDRNRLSRMLDILQNTGWLGAANICVLSDHGDEYSERCLAHTNSVTEGAVNIPICFIGPGVPDDGIDPELVRIIDVAPTLLALSGFDAEAMDGVSLVDRIQNRVPLGLTAAGETVFGPNERMRDFFDICIEAGELRVNPQVVTANRHITFARDQRWKLIVDRDLETMAETVELYDCHRDLLEIHNVASRYPRAVENLRAELASLLTGEPTTSYTAFDFGKMHRISQELKNMGYFRSNPHPE